MTDSAKKFLENLDADDLRRLSWLLAMIGRVEGWCSINRWIGKVVIAGAITILIMTSEAWMAIKHLLGWKQ